MKDFTQQYPDIPLRYFDVGEMENILLFQQVGQALGLEVGGVPFTVVCDQSLT